MEILLTKKNLVNFFGKKNCQNFFGRPKNFYFSLYQKNEKTRGRNLVVSVCFEKLTDRTQMERTRSARARAFARYFTEIRSE